MNDEAVVTCNLTANEVKLIQALIADRHKIFGMDGVPSTFGETRVGLKMLDCELAFEGKYKHDAR